MGEGFENKQTFGDGVTELFGRLKLTPEESKVLTVDDDLEEGLASSDCAIVDKIGFGMCA